MRLVNADTVVTIQVYDDMTEETHTKKMTIAEAIDEWSDEGCPPTVDAVEVVRCKDCGHCIHNEFFDTYCCWKFSWSIPVKKDGYCCWAERRQDKTD